MTVGHSNHAIEHLLELLRRHEVTAVADVRSVPASRFTPQFNHDPLKRFLADHGMKYVFLGGELGARPEDRSCYVDGHVRYDLLERSRQFEAGIQRLLAGAATERIAVLCAEQEPLDCHRTILVSKVLVERGADVDHIHRDGQLEPHDIAMERLMTGFGLDRDDLFSSWQERMVEALSRQEQRIAYVETDSALDEAQLG